MKQHSLSYGKAGPAMQNPHNQLNQGDSDISDEDFGDVDENIIVSAKQKPQELRQSNQQPMKPQDFNSYNQAQNQSALSSERKIQQISRIQESGQRSRATESPNRSSYYQGEE